MNRIDRRRFLVGSSGALLALPMLESLLGRRAAAATLTPPKRLLIVFHPHGRLVGNLGSDRWSFGNATGPLPSAATMQDPKYALAPLAAIRDEIVTLDGIDNFVRHTTGEGDGHDPGSRTALTCERSLATARDAAAALRPRASVDYVAGLGLVPQGSTMQTSIVVPASQGANATAAVGHEAGGGVGYFRPHFFGKNGTQPSYLSTDPGLVIDKLFGTTAVSPSPTPTLRERLAKRRASTLDEVSGSMRALRAQLNNADRGRLDEHAAFIQTLAQRNQAPEAPPPSSCIPPTKSSIGAWDHNDTTQGKNDEVIATAQIENIVQAFACDTVRVASLYFWLFETPTFPSMFGGNSPFAGNSSGQPFGPWHAAIHNQAADVPSLNTASHYYAAMFTKLIQRLAAVKDIDGSRLLDNTLVVWASDLGYGAVHTDYNVPVVMAGMNADPSAFPQGRGRHVAPSTFAKRRSLGDLWAHALRIVGASTSNTFGETGTVGTVAGAGTNLNAWASYQQQLGSGTPLHQGALDL